MYTMREMEMMPWELLQNILFDLKSDDLSFIAQSSPIIKERLAHPSFMFSYRIRHIAQGFIPIEQGEGFYIDFTSQRPYIFSDTEAYVEDVHHASQTPIPITWITEMRFPYKSASNTKMPRQAELPVFRPPRIVPGTVVTIPRPISPRDKRGFMMQDDVSFNPQTGVWVQPIHEPMVLRWSESSFYAPYVDEKGKYWPFAPLAFILFFEHGPEVFWDTSIVVKEPTFPMAENIELLTVDTDQFAVRVHTQAIIKVVLERYVPKEGKRFVREREAVVLHLTEVYSRVFDIQYDANELETVDYDYVALARREIFGATGNASENAEMSTSIFMLLQQEADGEINRVESFGNQQLPWWMREEPNEGKDTLTIQDQLEDGAWESEVDNLRISPTPPRGLMAIRAPQFLIDAVSDTRLDTLFKRMTTDANDDEDGDENEPRKRGRARAKMQMQRLMAL